MQILPACDAVLLNSTPASTRAAVPAPTARAMLPPSPPLLLPPSPPEPPVPAARLRLPQSARGHPAAAAHVAAHRAAPGRLQGADQAARWAREGLGHAASRTPLSCYGWWCRLFPSLHGATLAALQRRTCPGHAGMLGGRCACARLHRAINASGRQTAPALYGCMAPAFTMPCDTSLPLQLWPPRCSCCTWAAAATSRACTCAALSCASSPPACASGTGTHQGLAEVRHFRRAAIATLSYKDHSGTATMSYNGTAFV